MSDLSLLTGVYANVETYATLVDRVIEGLRQPAASGLGDERAKLANLLIDASTQGRTSRSREALILDSLLRDESGQQRIDLQALGQRLLSGTVDKTSQSQLEALAEQLEKERAEVASRLRGR
ncbi:MAG TPA: hypothetical protein VFA39_13505 [Steroidobacteraceae bacterium]|nr:hypothetical protein [Steroidobacteraceae bacterium]